MIPKSLPLLISAVFLVGCTENRMLRNLSAHIAHQQRDAVWLDSQVDSAPAATLNWKSALARMHSSNLGLQQSRIAVEEARKQPGREWLGLAPRLSGFVSLGDSISELTDFTSNVDARVVANFVIPNPVEFYATIYGAELQKQGAIWSNELDERRAFIQLYTAFVEAEAIRDAEQNLASLQASLSTAPLEQVEKLSKSFLSERDQTSRRRAYHRLSVNRLLNTPGANWNLTGSLPSISYQNRYRNIRFGNQFGKLAMNLQAVQIEAAQLSIYRVRYRQWPSISFGMSTPSLYSSQESGTEFSGDNTYLFSSATKTLDYTDLGGARSVKDAKQRLEFTRTQIRQRMEDETVRAKELGKAYSRLLMERDLIDKQLTNFRRSTSTDYSVLSAQLTAAGELRSRQSDIRKQLTQLDLQLLIWDETYWKN